MEKSLAQLEKGVAASFGYVRKDIILLNESFSDLHQKIQHLSMNHAALLEEIVNMRNKLGHTATKKTTSKTTKKKA